MKIEEALRKARKLMYLQRSPRYTKKKKDKDKKIQLIFIIFDDIYWKTPLLQDFFIKFLIIGNKENLNNLG